MDIMTIFLDLKHGTDAPNSISGCEAKRAKKGSSLSIKSSEHASETASNLPRKHSTFTGFNKTIMEPLADNPLFARFESYL